MSLDHLAWTTEDEIKALAYIGSKNPRYNSITNIPTTDQRVDKLECWLKHSYSRRWGSNINVDRLQKYAEKLLATI